MVSFLGGGPSVVPAREAVTDSEKQKLAAQLQELSRTSSGATKAILHAESALEQGAIAETELMVMNLERLKAASLEAEEVLLIYHGHPP